jgi:hypothetical protein
MKMEEDNEKYRKIVNALRRSRPVPDSFFDIEMAVLESVSKKEKRGSIMDFIFGWVHIGWVRRSLIAASFLLLGFFIWQQNNILNQIDHLGRQMRLNDKVTTYDPAGALERKQLLYRLTEEMDQSGRVMIPEDELNRLLDTLNDIRMRYRDIMDLIEGDPELKKMVEEKINKDIRSKINL